MLERQSFDSWAPRYNRSLLQFFTFVPVHRAVINEALVAGVTPGDILDVGCGTGLLLDRAAGQWKDARCTGIDYADAMIGEAMKNHAGNPRFRFKAGDAASLPVESAAFDIAFSTVSFHHWADQGGGIREIARALRPHGLFVLADIGLPRILRFLKRGAAGSRVRQRLFEQAGFSIIIQHRPIRIAFQVLVTVGRKIS